MVIAVQPSADTFSPPSLIAITGSVLFAFLMIVKSGLDANDREA